MSKVNYIICKEENKDKFRELGCSNFCNLEDMTLYEKIAFDFETDGLYARKNDVFCCQIGNGVDSNYLIVLYDNNYSFYDVIPYLQDKIICGHNICFDLGFMYKYNFFPKQVKDSMLSSKIIYNGDIYNATNDLKSVFKRELNIEVDKTEQSRIHITKLSNTSVIKYCFLDISDLLELHDALEYKIDKGGFRATYDLHCRHIRALAYMEQCGLAISSQKWREKMNEDVINCSKHKQAIEEYIYDNLPQFRENQLDMFCVIKKSKILLSSPSQMIKVFNALGILTKDKDGKDSINEEIISKSKHEFVKMWLNFQEANHRVSTFGETIYNKIEKERIYTNFNPMVDTARLSTRKGGINFLNFPADKYTRNCFVANPGNIMVVADFSAQEGVIMADLSGDKAMTKSVVDGDDLHCMFARVLFPELKDFSDEEITKDYKSKRQDSKVPRFLLN